MPYLIPPCICDLTYGDPSGAALCARSYRAPHYYCAIPGDRACWGTKHRSLFAKGGA